MSAIDDDWIMRHVDRRLSEDPDAYRMRLEMISQQLARLTAGPIEVSQVAEIQGAGVSRGGRDRGRTSPALAC